MPLEIMQFQLKVIAFGNSLLAHLRETEIRFSHAVESYKLLLISITTRGKTNSVNER